MKFKLDEHPFIHLPILIYFFLDKVVDVMRGYNNMTVILF